MKLKNLVAIAGAGALALGGAMVGATPAQAATQGTVTCSNGKAIQGIWIDAGSKSQWANRWSLNGRSDYNGWSASNLNSGDVYQISVGCGGWSVTDRSSKSTHASADFVCVDGYATGKLNFCWES